MIFCRTAPAGEDCRQPLAPPAFLAQVASDGDTEQNLKLVKNSMKGWQQDLAGMGTSTLGYIEGLTKLIRADMDAVAPTLLDLASCTGSLDLELF